MSSRRTDPRSPSTAAGFWVVIPAAGSARRMGASPVPKQYLTIGDRTVIEHALQPFLARSDCRGVVVALAGSDTTWSTLTMARDPRMHTVIGGSERRDSVQAGLDALSVAADPSDWVLVHDAARPCLSDADLKALLETLWPDEVGGLLACPLVDTLKRADANGRVAATVDRTALWQALTPQMFRYGVLTRALAQARTRELAVTDEASAVEALGLQPAIVQGSADNLKITLPQDLLRAERILRERGAVR